MKNQHPWKLTKFKDSTKEKEKVKVRQKESQVGQHGVSVQEVPGKVEEEEKVKVVKKAKEKAKERKAKEKTKGKRGSKGGSKGSKGNDRCRLCGQSGHWGNECPNRMVNQAAETNTTDNASTHAPSSSASTSTGSDRRVIRQVKMFHMGTPPSALPEAFEVCTSEEEELELQWCRVVQEFPLTENELPEENVKGDGWQAWHELEFLECDSDAQVI